jgi:hypothetical protein
VGNHGFGKATVLEKTHGLKESTVLEEPTVWGVQGFTKTHGIEREKTMVFSLWTPIKGPRAL